MKKVFIALIALLAVVCFAEPKAYVLNIPMGTNTTVTSTFGGDKGIVGKLDTIMVSVSDNASTGVVQIAYDPMDAYASNVEIATNVVTASKTWRPRYDGTDINGAALSNDTLDNKLLLVGESVAVTISGSPTGVNWRVTLKMDE